MTKPNTQQRRGIPLPRCATPEPLRCSGPIKVNQQRQVGEEVLEFGREYGFGPWAIRDLRDEGFLGGAELRFAGDGIEGIAPDEVEAGWWVTKERRNQGIGSEAMHAAIGDLWDRTDAESITAYIEEGDNAASRQLAAKLGFVVRGQGRGRSGEPMTVYELRRDVWQRRGG